MRGNGEFVPALRRSLQARLDDLNAERQVIKRTLAVLDDRPRRTRPRGTAGDTGSHQTLLDHIRAAPGTRASMLAMVTGREPETIERELRELEQRGQVRRTGLGWSAERA